MRYYIDNFRGLQNQIIDLKNVNFLVGENSTGKTSLIKAISLLSNFNFLMRGELFSEDFDVGTFEDILSAEHDKDFFVLGVILDDIKCLNVSCFYNFEGLSRLGCQLFYTDSTLVSVNRKLDSSDISYKIVRNLDFSYDTPREIINYLNKKQYKREKEFKLSSDFSRTMPLYFCLQHLFNNNTEIRKIFKKQCDSLLMHARDCAYIAPIRAKPQNFYSGINASFNAEGSQTPYVIRNAIKTNSRKIDTLKIFGKESGLFDDVVTSVFGNKALAPFELKIRKGKNEYKISSVGYGVSQILPIIVDTLFSNTQIKLIQQPEVHLHPKAQAAFGQFLYKMSKINQKKIYIIETHSDYVIDRFRYCKKNDEEKISAQIYFSQNDGYHNQLQIIPIKNDGTYDENDISGYRSFFVNEAMKLMEI